VQYNGSGPHDSAYPEPTGIYTQGGVVEATVTSVDGLHALLASEARSFQMFI
jgi:hypothetical protein